MLKCAGASKSKKKTKMETTQTRVNLRFQYKAETIWFASDITAYWRMTAQEKFCHTFQPIRILKMLCVEILEDR